MLKLIIFSLCLWSVYGYFTLPGKCPDVVGLENFDINEFYGKWYQSYYYSSDGQKRNNCSTITVDIEGKMNPSIYFNQSRIDRGLFHRYSMASVSPHGLSAGDLELTFLFKDAPRRLRHRTYKFQVLASNYKFYATAYTCQYSPLINKHFIYVWLLSRNPILNDVSKELAMRPLQTIGVDTGKLVKEDFSKCTPKYYENSKVEPNTFRYPVPLN